MDIKISIESKRGCGYRKAGGLYLVGESFGEGCHRLPFDLTLCPLCGHGIRPSRAWTWIEGYELFKPFCSNTSIGQVTRSADQGSGPILHQDPSGRVVFGDPGIGKDTHCFRCVICNPSLLFSTDEVKEGDEKPNRGKSGLIWVGEKFYRFPESFIAEANRINISRRIKAVPQGFVLGETWVFLAHVKAIFNREDGKVTYKPGIFRAYQPTGIEYVVKGDETDEALEKKIKRGITLVKVEMEGVTSDMDLGPSRGFEPPATDDLRLRDTDLSRKTILALEAAGLKNVKEIMSLTKADLLKIKGIGKALAAKIVKQFNLKG